jgi:hypothetical protein
MPVWRHLTIDGLARHAEQASEFLLRDMQFGAEVLCKRTQTAGEPGTQRQKYHYAQFSAFLIGGWFGLPRISPEERAGAFARLSAEFGDLVDAVPRPCTTTELTTMKGEANDRQAEFAGRDGKHAARARP